VRRLVAVAVLLALGTLGCGTATRGPDGAATAGPREPTDFLAEVTAVQALPHAAGFRFTVRVPAGPDPDCATAVSARQDSYEHRTHHVSTTVTSSAAYGDCPGSVAREVELRVPVRSPDLAVNQELWTAAGDGTYRRCSPELGCRPPADRCDPAWTSLLTDGTELPPEERVRVLGCADGWLVADVDAVVTGCQGVDGATPPPGCAGTGVHARWFARLVDGAWQVVASGDAAGCAGVHAEAPEFPEALCRDLPPRA
jgi:hypothetical protein